MKQVPTKNCVSLIPAEAGMSFVKYWKRVEIPTRQELIEKIFEAAEMDIKTGHKITES